MNLVSVGDQVEDGDYILHSRFSKAVNFVKVNQEHGHSQEFPLLTCVSQAIGAGPTNIVFRFLPPILENRCSLAGDQLVWGHLKYGFDASIRYQSSLQISDVPGGQLLERLKLLEAELIQQASPKSLVFLLQPDMQYSNHPGFEQALRRRCRDSVRELLSGHVLAGVALIKGVGFGLTPGGDDFLTGLLLGLWFRQQITDHEYGSLRENIYSAALGKNLLSNTFLHCAKEGWLFERWQPVMKFLAGARTVSEQMIVQAVLTFGETSGADTMTGLVFALRHAENMIRET